MSLRFGRPCGSPDYSFAMRMQIVQFCKAEGHLREQHGALRKDPQAPQVVQLPFLPGAPPCSLNKAISWHHTSMDEEWESMRMDPGLRQKYGEMFFERRSRLPNEWIDHLNKSREVKGLHPLKNRGRLPYVKKYPALVPLIRETDERHREIRMGPAGSADHDGFRQTLKTLTALHNVSQHEEGQYEVFEVVGKVSRKWVGGQGDFCFKQGASHGHREGC